MAVFDLGLCVTDGVAAASFNIALNKPRLHVYNTTETTPVNPKHR